MVELVPLGSAIVAGVFAVTLARQYRSRRRLHQLIWTVSMILFSLATFLEFVMSVVTVTGPLFDLYYLLIGPETGLLGAGVVYLMRPRLGKYVLYAVIALSACLVVSVAVWPVDLSGLVAGLSPPATYQQEFQSSVVNAISYAVSAFAAVPRGITMVLSIAGAILVVGGGVLSFVLDRRRTYALVIAFGALMDAVGGILLGMLGDPEVFFYFEFLGIVFLFLGFLMSSRGAFKTSPVQGGQSAAGTA